MSIEEEPRNGYITADELDALLDGEPPDEVPYEVRIRGDLRRFGIRVYKDGDAWIKMLDRAKDFSDKVERIPTGLIANPEEPDSAKKLFVKDSRLVANAVICADGVKPVRPMGYWLMQCKRGRTGLVQQLANEVIRVNTEEAFDDAKNASGEEEDTTNSSSRSVAESSIATPESCDVAD